MQPLRQVRVREDPCIFRKRDHMIRDHMRVEHLHRHHMTAGHYDIDNYRPE